MAINAQILAGGPDWNVSEVLCTHDGRDRVFVEQHEQMSVAVVLQGSFQYRTGAGSAMMVPGALLLGNAGSCFECGHEHARGDRCLAFRFAPAFVEQIAAGVPGARKAAFARASVPPAGALISLLADADVARIERDAPAFDELAVRLAGAALTIAGAGASPSRDPKPPDERRITRAVRYIEAHADEEVGLERLAREAAMSPYHFLRVFRHVVGMTPHQYLLHTRLCRVARRLRGSGEPISAIALEAGFNDLATFNRRFRRMIGVTPGAFRAGKSTALTARPASTPRSHNSR